MKIMAGDPGEPITGGRKGVKLNTVLRWSIETGSKKKLPMTIITRTDGNSMVRVSAGAATTTASGDDIDTPLQVAPAASVTVAFTGLSSPVAVFEAWVDCDDRLSIKELRD
jgi:hypothetical protein